MKKTIFKEIALVLLVMLWSVDCAIIFFHQYRHIWISIITLIASMLIFGKFRINVLDVTLLLGVFFLWFFWQKDVHATFMPLAMIGIEYFIGKAIGKGVWQVNKKCLVWVALFMGMPFVVRALLNYSYFLTHEYELTTIWPYWEVPSVGMPRTQHEFFLIIPATLLIFWIISIKAYRISIVGMIEAAVCIFLGLYGRGRLAFCSVIVVAIAVGSLYTFENRTEIDIISIIKKLMIMLIGAIILWFDQGRVYSALNNLHWDSDGGIFHNVRFILWKNALKLMFQHPFGASEYKIEREIDQWVDGNAHNSWVDVGYCGGVIPFVLILLFTVFIFVCLYKLWKNVQEKEKYAIITPFLGMTLYHMFEPGIIASPSFWCAEVFLGGIIVGWWLEIRYNNLVDGSKQIEGVSGE